MVERFLLYSDDRFEEDRKIEKVLRDEGISYLRVPVLCTPPILESPSGGIISGEGYTLNPKELYIFFKGYNLRTSNQTCIASP
jgi:hypothetical protein|tara:strand:- start:769 stop:1017 length:249 start_codon:yes stop_codon:yes gene_type:complete